MHACMFDSLTHSSRQFIAILVQNNVVFPLGETQIACRPDVDIREQGDASVSNVDITQDVSAPIQSTNHCRYLSY